MKNEKDYLSEFEQEWNSDSEVTGVQHDEFELDNEDNNFEVNAYNDTEADNEFENDEEMENDEEFENDPEFESMDEGEFEAGNDANKMYEDRLYSVLRNDHESELEFEQQLNEVLHEMEKDYFWGGLKKRWNKFKKSSIFNTLKNIAKNSPLGDTIKQVTSVARGDIKGMLKGLAGQALTAAVPGGAVAKQLLNLEAPVSSTNPRKNAQVINHTAKAAYTSFINQLSNINSSNQLRNLRALGQASFNQAWQRQQTGKRHHHTRHIILRRGQRLVIKVI